MKGFFDKNRYFSFQGLLFAFASALAFAFAGHDEDDDVGRVGCGGDDGDRGWEKGPQFYI